MLRNTMALLLVVALAAPALAAVIPYAPAGVEIAVPDKWKSETKGEVVSVTAPDGEMAIVFYVLPAGTPDKVFEDLDKKIEAGTGKIKWEDKPTKDKINGMETEIWNGTAKDGKMQVEALYLESPNGKNLGIYWFDTPESEKKYAKEIDQIVKGLKPTAGAKKEDKKEEKEEKKEEKKEDEKKEEK